jgi:deazaflavin-dependent oxidoreductase (nitroreductase family)
MATQASVSRDALRRRARMMRFINPVMRTVLRVPVRTPLSSRLMVVTHTGRRTGRLYHQPVSYVRDGDVLLTPGGGRWTRNLHEGHPVELRVAGRRVTARPELVDDAETVELLLGHMLEPNPRLTSFVPFIGADGTINREAMAIALAHGFCVVRWHLDPAASS